MIYAHKNMATLMSTKLPDGVTLDRTYASRGWCSFECFEGQLIKPQHLCIDLGNLIVCRLHKPSIRQRLR